jgi:mRNA interferase RelE/StbE
MTAYAIRFKRSAKKELEALTQKTQKRIVADIESLADDPRPQGAIKLTTSPLWRIRSGDFRVLYEIQDDILMVYVVKVADRKDVYRCL